jgi:hypothetical protein
MQGGLAIAAFKCHIRGVAGLTASKEVSPGPRERKSTSGFRPDYPASPKPDNPATRGCLNPATLGSWRSQNAGYDSPDRKFVL